MAVTVSLRTMRTVGAVSVVAFTLAGCGGENPFASLNLGFGQQSDKEEITATETGTGTGDAVQTVERDVEAPEVFEVNEKALWDGRPSLGGVWVAHPDNKEPERVIIRNEANGKFVIGALFRRERDLPGPALQLSSDAAQSLDVQAGSPTVIRVTALRREEVPVAEEKATPTPNPNAEAVTAAPLSPAETETLAKTALASIDRTKASSTPAAPAKAAIEPRPAAAASAQVDKPYVQIGFFSVEDNAKANVAVMNSSGIPAKIVTSTAQGKTFWRVLAGPATTEAEQRELLGMVKKQGYSDAYFVKG